MILNHPVALADNTTMDRSRFGLDLTLQDLELSRVPMTDEEVEEKYESIRGRSGVLTIMGIEYKAQLSDIVDVKELGRGSFGVVRKARFKQTKTLMAVKIIPITGNAENNKRTVMDMDVIIRSHNCPNIVRCYGCFVFEHIMHRDVKPSNILIDHSGTIKLCDFGIAGRLIDSRRAETNTKGCTAYLAPERVASSDCEYGVRADVWSLGITLIELAKGTHPYEGCSTDFELLTKIINDPPPRLSPAQHFSQTFSVFIARCLMKRPIDRPNYHELLEDPFIRGNTTDTAAVAKWYSSLCV
ncbi:kinase domain protein [Onchocerca flexuosa]|uniref:mitogen-activated protein kinase kinase n=2 Tax=Onchocerca flexuosa TaxID=387005 RepID=A0A238BTZ0_9BILA|nr:kinase domain protein [Onchocerca flexuosa]